VSAAFPFVKWQDYAPPPIIWNVASRPEKNVVMSIFKIADLSHLGFKGSNNGFFEKPK